MTASNKNSQPKPLSAAEKQRVLDQVAKAVQNNDLRYKSDANKPN